MPARRFPPPWSVEDNGAAFIVKDRGRQPLERLGWAPRYGLDETFTRSAVYFYQNRERLELLLRSAAR